MEGKSGEARKLFESQGSGGSLRDIQSRTASELKALEGKRKAAEELLIVTGSSDEDRQNQGIKDAQSPVAAELHALKGKRSEATRLFADKSAGKSPISRPLLSRTVSELKALEGKRKEAAEQLASPRSSAKRVDPTKESELRSLQGRKKEAMTQYVRGDRRSSDGNLTELKSRTASELTALEGKRRDAEESFQHARAVVEQKEVVAPPSKAEEREFFQVKKVFGLVNKDHRQRIGREDVGMIVLVFQKTTGKSFAPSEIDAAFANVDEDKSGRIDFGAFYQLYKDLYIES
uniref:EF-hand domain-containing protein n=1 Tax=Odontella aurita TaxID=265563 RepID=A0A7S4K5C1_9STRA